MRRYFIRHIRSFALAVLGSILLPGCYTQLALDGTASEPTGGRYQPWADVEYLKLRTERPWYELSSEDEHVEIWAEIENTGRATVPLAGCPNPPSFVIEEWDGSSWWDEASRGIFCEEKYRTRVMELRPGELVEFKFRLREKGWYRLRLLIGPDLNSPDAVAYSNQFLVK